MTKSEMLRSQKVEVFSERETTTEVIEWASQAGGPEAATAAMMMYNTLLEGLAKIEDQGDQNEN